MLSTGSRLLLNVSQRATASHARLYATDVASRSTVTLKNTKVINTRAALRILPGNSHTDCRGQHTATARAAGKGRSGQVHSNDEAPLTLGLALPKGLGGPGDGTNPEQLFAMGYACTSRRSSPSHTISL